MPTEVHVGQDDDLAVRLQRSALGQHRQTSHVVHAQRRPAPVHQCRSGWLPARACRQTRQSPHPPSGQSSAARKGMRRRQAAVAGRAKEQIGVDRTSGGGAQRRHRRLLTDHIVEQRRCRYAVAHAWLVRPGWPSRSSHHLDDTGRE